MVDDDSPKESRVRVNVPVEFFGTLFTKLRSAITNNPTTLH